MLFTTLLSTSFLSTWQRVLNEKPPKTVDWAHFSPLRLFATLKNIFPSKETLFALDVTRKDVAMTCQESGIELPTPPKMKPGLIRGDALGKSSEISLVC